MSIRRYLSITLASIILVSLVLVGFGSIAVAKYPEKTITYMVIFKVGGGADRWARVMSSAAIDHFGVPWHVVNVPPPIVGWKEALRRKPDGYTVIQGSPTPVIALLREEEPPISPYNIKIVCYISGFRPILVSKPDVPWATWEGLKNYANKNPGELTVGGTSSSVLGQASLFAQAGLELNMIPYGSTSDAVADFLGGHIDMATMTLSTVKILVPEEAVAVVNASEIPITTEGFEDLPTAKDLGYEGMFFPRWVGVHPDTPDEIVEFISEKMGGLLQDKAVITLITRLGEEIIFVPCDEAQEAYNKMVEGMRRAIKLL